VPRLYLLFSAAGVAGLALIYGADPATILPNLLDVSVDSTDLTHVFRAIMGLYLGMIALWLLGVIRSDFTRAAVVAEIFFMFGLAAGRVLSLVMDGVPSAMLVISTALELAMGIGGLLILKHCTAPTPIPTGRVPVDRSGP
jgi:hypothetical protein